MALVFGPRDGASCKPATSSFSSARLTTALSASPVLPLPASNSPPSAVLSSSTTSSLFKARKSHRLSLKQSQSRHPARLRRPLNPPLQRIEAFLREVSSSVPQFGDTHRVPSVLTITSVPATAVDQIQQRLDTLICRHENCPKGAKLDYNVATESLSIISFPSWEHEHIAGINFEIMLRLSADNNAFTGNNPRFRIVSGGSTNIPLPGLLPAVNPPLQRQPDGSLRLLMMDNPPFLVWEILDSQPLQQMEHKVREYFVGTAGKVRIVIILQLLRQPPPQKAGKRKRNRGSLGDEERELQILDDSVASHGSLTAAGPPTTAGPPEVADDTAPTPPGEPTATPTPPPPGTVIRGLFWVYTHATSTSTNGSSILCLENSREFYPHRPSGALELTWQHVFGASSVPPELADKVISLPYDIFHDKLAEITLPREVWPGDEVGSWDAVKVEGIEGAESELDGGSFTGSQSSSAWSGSRGDEEFVGDGGGGAVQDGAERRSTRLAVRQEAARAAGGSA